MSEAYEFVYEFHKIYGCDISEDPTFGTPELRELRKELIREEAEEFASAIDSKDFVGALDALADLLYVTYGAAISFGVDLDEAVRRVHESNLSKLGIDGKPIYRADGKILKGPNFFQPKLEDLCGRH